MNRSKSQNTSQVSSTKLFKRALNAQKLGKQQEAVDLYTRLLQDDPDNSDALYNRATVLLDLGQYEQSLEDLSKSIKLNPTRAEAYNQRGLANYYLQQYSKAVQDYSRAIQKKKTLTEAYTNRSESYTLLGESELALKDCKIAIKLDPRDSYAYFYKGVSLHMLGKVREAINNYTLSSTYSPEACKFTMYNRGSAHFDLGGHQEALNDYQRAIELDDTYAAAYYNRGAVHIELSEYENALKDFTRFLELEEKETDYKKNKYYQYAMYNRAIANHELGQYAQALKDYDRVLQADPKHVDALINRTIVKKHLGEKDQALKDIQKAIQINPKSGDAYYHRGYLYYSLGNTGQSQSDFNKAVRLEKRFSKVPYSLVEQGEQQAASAEAENVVHAEFQRIDDQTEECSLVPGTPQNDRRFLFTRDDDLSLCTTTAVTASQNSNTVESNKSTEITKKSADIQAKDKVSAQQKKRESGRGRKGKKSARNLIIDSESENDEEEAQYDAGDISVFVDNDNENDQETPDFSTEIQQKKTEPRRGPMIKFTQVKKGRTGRRLIRSASASSNENNLSENEISEGKKNANSKNINTDSVSQQDDINILNKNKSTLIAKSIPDQDVILECTKGLALDSKNSDLYRLRGTALSELKRSNEAISDFDQVLLRDTECAVAYYRRAAEHMRLQNFKQAVQDFQQLADLGGCFSKNVRMERYAAEEALRKQQIEIAGLANTDKENHAEQESENLSLSLSNDFEEKTPIQSRKTLVIEGQKQLQEYFGKLYDIVVEKNVLGKPQRGHANSYFCKRKSDSCDFVLKLYRTSKKIIYESILEKTLQISNLSGIKDTANYCRYDHIFAFPYDPKINIDVLQENLTTTDLMYCIVLATRLQKYSLQKRIDILREEQQSEEMHMERTEFVSLARTLANTLYELESQGIHHLNIKPQNVLIEQMNPLPVYILSDCGLWDIQKQLWADQSTAGNKSKTSLNFMSPELQQCVQGSEEYINNLDAYDVWSLGITLYCAYNLIPSGAQSRVEKLKNELLQENSIQSLEEIKDEKIKYLLKRMLQKDLCERISLKRIVDYIQNHIQMGY